MNIKYYEISDFRQSPPLLMMVTPRGLIACGYFDAGTYSDLGQAAVILRGVSTFDEMRERKIAQWRDISQRAYALGIRKDMTGQQVLDRFQAGDEDPS